MRECNIQLDEKGDLDILRLDGSLDAYSFPRLETTLSQLQENERNRVILDCSSLEYVSSAALGALIGFAGARVIKETIQQDLPPGFQRPDFLLKHGLLDQIVARGELKATLVRLLDAFCGPLTPSEPPEVPA